MAVTINLRQAKKLRARVEKRAASDENAARFGQTKAMKSLEKARAEKARAILDNHKREPE